MHMPFGAPPPIANTRPTIPANPFAAKPPAPVFGLQDFVSPAPTTSGPVGIPQFAGLPGPGFTPPAPEPDPDDVRNDAALVAEYIALRDAKKALEAAHKDKLEPLSLRMDRIELVMRGRLVGGNVQSVKTGNGTAFLKDVRKFNVTEPEQFMQWCIESGNTQLLGRSIRQEATTEYVDANNTLPPGVAVYAEKVTQFRK
jgi:hypothetical protein